MFGMSCIGSGGGGEVTSLVGVECDDNGMSVMGVCEEKGLYAAVMIGRVCKKVWVDGVGFEVKRVMECNEEVIVSMVCGLSEVMIKLGPWCGERFARFGAVEEVKGI